MGKKSIKTVTVSMDKDSLELKREDSIMVIDDNFQLRKLLTTVLISYGYNVKPVESTEKALSYIHEGFNLILCDTSMPGLSGINFMKTVRQRCPETEFILMTIQPGINHTVEAVKAGAYDFLQKPFDLDSLESKVKKAVKASHESTERKKASGEYKKEIANYGLVNMIGEGGMGIVYLTERLADKKKFAMKVMREKFLATDMAEHRDRFKKEGETAAGLNHPNIIRVYEYGLTEESDIPYMVMEYFDCDTLKSLITFHKGMELAKKVEVIKQIAMALAYAHDRGVVHRDIKPANILINSQGQVKLTDFGIVQLPDSDQTLLHKVIGTPKYLAPEAFFSPKVDLRADIYSLGNVAYEFFVGAKPFEIDSVQTLGRVIQTENPPEPREIINGFPVNLQSILEKMLKKDPAKRYSSAHDLIKDLDKVLKKGFKNNNTFSLRRWNTLK